MYNQLMNQSLSHLRSLSPAATYPQQRDFDADPGIWMLLKIHDTRFLKSFCIAKVRANTITWETRDFE
jgi:hypothetical protein